MGDNGYELEAAYAGWRERAEQLGLDVAESDHEFRLHITHTRLPYRGVLHVRLNYEEDTPCEVTLWGATESTPWANLTEEGALRVLDVLAAAVSVKPWFTLAHS